MERVSHLEEDISFAGQVTPLWGSNLHIDKSGRGLGVSLLLCASSMLVGQLSLTAGRDKSLAGYR